MPRERSCLVVVCALLTGLGAAASPGEAAWPGQNGRIVFTQFTPQRDRFDTPAGYLCSAGPTGAAQTKLVSGAVAGGVEGSPAFSPDGSRIAFVRGATTTIGRLAVAAADGSGARTIGDVSGSRPQWSADGRSIYLAQGGDLVRVAVADGSTERLTATADLLEDWPAESPDGTSLAYVAVTPGSTRRSLVVRDLAGGAGAVLREDAELEQPRWSPDGRRLVFSAGRSLWTVAADGSGLRRLTSGHADLEPDYSPDGSRIVLIRDGDVWTVAADGGDPRRVTATPVSEYGPAWQRADATVPAAGSAPCAITGTDGDDVLVGSEGPDVFFDGPGDDVVRGLGGDDYVLDGPGADTIATGAGNDVVHVAAGRATVLLGEGDDAVSTPAAMRDAVASVVADGGPGDDRLDGTDGADRLLGGEGDDVVNGLRGPDLLFGGPGNDRVSGNRGDDAVDGGSGDDVLLGGRISGQPAAYDGYDLVRGGSGNDRLAGGWQKDRLFGGRGADRLAGGPHADFVKGDEGRDVLLGEAGDDVLLARRDGARDAVWGGPGTDRATLDAVDRSRGVERLLR